MLLSLPGPRKCPSCWRFLECQSNHSPWSRLRLVMQHRLRGRAVPCAGQVANSSGIFLLFVVVSHQKLRPAGGGSKIISTFARGTIRSCAAYLKTARGCLRCAILPTNKQERLYHSIVAFDIDSATSPSLPSANSWVRLIFCCQGGRVCTWSTKAPPTPHVWSFILAMRHNSLSTGSRLAESD